MLHWDAESTENSPSPLAPDPNFFHQMKYLESSHTFTMKFDADMNEWFPPAVLPTLAPIEANAMLWGPFFYCEAPYTQTCSSNEDGSVNSVLIHTYQVSNKWVAPLGELVQLETCVCHQHLMLCTWWMEATEAKAGFHLFEKWSTDLKCTKDRQLDAYVHLSLIVIDLKSKLMSLFLNNYNNTTTTNSWPLLLGLLLICWLLGDGLLCNTVLENLEILSTLNKKMPLNKTAGFVLTFDFSGGYVPWLQKFF